MHLGKRWSPQVKTVKPAVLHVIAIVIAASLVLWLVALFFAYMADDWGTPPADERSIPAVRTY